MSTPAFLEDAREARPAAPRLVAAERPRPRISPAVTLTVLFGLAAVYHAVWGAFHATPAIFTDELLHSSLAQAFASGNPFVIREAHVFFPAFLPALIQAPAWLFGDAETSYTVAKTLNAIVMSAAVFPAYWLARQLVRPSYALLVSAVTVASPALLYHSYLLSEALAYPVFLTTCAVYVRALAEPSRRWGAVAVGVSMLAVGTRAQFVVLPLVFCLLLAARPRDLRRHAVPMLGLGVLAVAALVGGTALLGTYAGVTALDVNVGGVAHWAFATALLIPFGVGLVLFPGAVAGLAAGAARPRSAAERAFAWLTLGICATFLLEVGIVAAGDSERPLERYVIYLAPLLAIAFFAYVERGAPARRIYAGLALALGLAAWLMPFPSLADYRFSFDSPVLSAYGTLAFWSGTANAATVFAAVPLLIAVALVLRPLTARSAHVLGVVCVCLLVATGAIAYAGDHQMTERARAAWSAEPADWLDKSGYGQADFLALPGSSPHSAWSLEAWNRDFGRPLWLAGKRPPIDPWAAGDASVSETGTLLVDGQPAAAGLLVVSDFATQIDLEGETLLEPGDGLRLVRVPAEPHVASLTRGLYYDGWTNGDVRYRTWPSTNDGGTYRITVSLPADLDARPVTFAVEGGEAQVVLLEPGRSVDVELRAAHAAQVLRISSPRAEFLDGGTANPRLVSFRVDRLEFGPDRPAALSF